MQDFGASNLSDGAGNFEYRIKADEKDRFKVEKTLKQQSALAMNYHANSIIRHI